MEQVPVIVLSLKNRSGTPKLLFDEAVTVTVMYELMAAVEKLEGEIAMDEPCTFRSVRMA
jgi:hypothetical protein